VSGPPRNFSGREIEKVLTSFNYRKDRQRGSHSILKYTNPGTGETQRSSFLVPK